MSPINLAETFEHFPNAPIVEAVFDIRARTRNELSEVQIRKQLDASLHGFTFMDSLNEFQHEVRFENPTESPRVISASGWKGVRYRTTDGTYIAQFGTEGFALSRLAPYQDWATLSADAAHLWRQHLELANPGEITRLGLRFINRIVIPPGDVEFENYFKIRPAPPAGLQALYADFLQRETLAIPGTPYQLTLIKTIQLPTNPLSEGLSLIVDIDVFSNELIALPEDSVSHRFNEMRWLKNKAFFGSVTEPALALFR